MTRIILAGYGRRTRNDDDSDEPHWEEHQFTVAYRRGHQRTLLPAREIGLKVCALIMSAFPCEAL